MRAIRFDHHGEPIEVLRCGATCSRTCGWRSKVSYSGEISYPASAVNPSVRGHHPGARANFPHPSDLKATILHSMSYSIRGLRNPGGMQ